ncbi:MAG TPA: MMPL family transporter [Solirubrobacteraceae bacterium]|jgi:RND superfamily putative drug exporter
MLKLARWSTTHRKYVLIGWIVLLFAVNAIAQSAGTHYSNNFTLPNSDAQRANDLLHKSFPVQAGDRDQIVFHVSSGSVLDPAVRTRMSSAFAAVGRVPHVTAVLSPYTGSASSSSISRDQRTAFATVVFDKRANELSKDAAKPVVSAARAAVRPGLQVELGGQAIEATQQEGFGVSTAVGLLAAIVVLLLTFGSLTAMGLPIITALFGLGTGLGVIALGTNVVDTADFSSELAAMIGLGVGIDYALFIVTRFRELYATPGPTFEDARESTVHAMDTAGRAVLFAGVTVVIALLGMMLLGVDFLYGVAIAASVGVLLVMSASLTLLPALLATWGKRLARPSRRARRRSAKASAAGAVVTASLGEADGAVAGSTATVAGGPTGAWHRWSELVQRRPWTIAVVSGLVMLVIAAPATALRLGSSDAGNDPANLTTHRAYELLANGFGKGFNGPLQIVAKPSGSGGTMAGTARLRDAIAATGGVVAVTRPLLNPAGDVATLSVYPRSSPQAYATTQLVSRLRNRVIPPVAARTGLTVYVGGVTAGGVDFASVLSKKLPLFIGVVVLLSALLLMIVFRSLVIPLQAAVMNLLSIGASMGVIVAIFQWGWLGGLIGVSQGPIEAFIPVMLFAIVFGLSMDYEVFLVSRIHERWVRTGDSSRAVGDGLALTGRVVTAAAAIMVCVFLSFMLGNNRVIKEFGLSLASAVFLDALVVRCLLLPAVLSIVGRRTWVLPAWLDRILPRLNIEGSTGVPAAAEADAEAAARGHRPRGRGEVAAEGADG